MWLVRDRTSSKAWTAFPAIERALELAGPNLTADTIVEACETGFKDYENGIIGPVTYSPKRHNGENSAQVWSFTILNKWALRSFSVC